MVSKGHKNMKKRIYLSFLSLIIISVALISISVGAYFLTVNKNREIDAIKDRAVLLADFLNAQGYINLADYTSYASSATRLTIIAEDGTVLVDNKAVATEMENHGDRDEITGAKLKGESGVTRVSDTLGRETYYYAIRLNDGNILRVSKTMSSITDNFLGALIVTVACALAVLLIANYFAKTLTEAIVEPFLKVNFDNDELPDAVYDELSPYIRKIKDQKNQIAEKMTLLQSRADTIEIITENMKEGLVLINGRGVVLTANKTAMELLGLDITEKNVSHICRDIDFSNAVKKCLGGEPAESICELSSRKYHIALSPVLQDGSLNGGVIFFFDITERLEAEKMRREFSANVSHELKTPLTSISALAEMIETGIADNGDIKGFAEKISGESHRLISIIDNIIKLSEFDEKKADAEYTEFDILELANSAAEALGQKAADKNVSISVCGEGFRVSANIRMIDELVYNLIDNAIKYNRENGKVEVLCFRENGYWAIDVKDTGIGIPPVHHDRVFERFYGVDKSRCKKTGGTGLGLSIVKHIAEHHNGNVRLTSKEGAGTTVMCRFPVKE